MTSWSMPVLIATSILSGLLIATYIKTDQSTQEERSLKVGGLGGFFSFIATVGIALLFYAVRKRVLSESMCSIKFTNYSNRGKKVEL